MRTWWIIPISVIVLACVANADPIRLQKHASIPSDQNCLSTIPDFRFDESSPKASLLAGLRQPVRILDRDLLEEITRHVNFEDVGQIIQDQLVPDLPDLTLYHLPYELQRVAGL